MEYEGLFCSNCKETELGSVNTALKATNRRDFFRQQNNYRNREEHIYGAEISDCQSIGRLSHKLHCIANKLFISVNNGNDDVCKQSSIKLATYIQGDDLLNKIYTKVRNVLDISHATENPKQQQQAPSHNNTFDGSKKVRIKYRSYIIFLCIASHCCTIIMLSFSLSPQLPPRMSLFLLLLLVLCTLIPHTAADTVTFSATGATQTFTVPTGVTLIT